MLWRALGCILAHTRPCHGPLPVVSQESPTVSQAPQLYRSTGSAVSQHCIATHPAAKPSFCHDTSDCTLASPTARLSLYKDCIVTQPPVASPSLLSRYKTVYRDTIHQLGRARAHCRPCRGLPWLCRGLGSAAVSWPTMRVPAHLLRAQACLPGHAYQALCHNTTCCIVTHT